MKIPAIFGLMALTALAACGNDRGAVAGVDLMKASVANIGKKPAPKRLTQADLALVQSPAQVVTIENTGQMAFVGELRARGGVETWASLDDVTISMRNGVILATRGFGADLMAADVPNVGQLLSGAKNYARAHTLLTGDDQPQRQIYRCDAANNGRQSVEVFGLSYSVTKVVETCQSEEQSFQNEYWFGGDSQLRKSRQWVGPDAGYLTIEDVRRR